MSSNDSNITQNFDLSLMPLASKSLSPNQIFNFNTIPQVLHERLFELSSTAQLMKLGETSSYCSKLAKRYNGKYPVDRLEIRELQPADPIHFNQFRYKSKTEKIIKFLIDGEIIGGGTFKEFLELIQNIDYVYAKINMTLPVNAEKIFMTWLKNQDKSKKLQLIVIQPLPLPTKLFTSKALF
uniref:Uncharacterized protein n=1 Tax=Panagrolaimus sp. ES5 TaxID=591445 RepID=A0AC34G5C5_9BILA